MYNYHFYDDITGDMNIRFIDDPFSYSLSKVMEIFAFNVTSSGSNELGRAAYSLNNRIVDTSIIIFPNQI